MLEGNQVGQVWFTLGKYVLALPSHFLHLCEIFLPEIWEDSPHDFLRNQSEFDPPVVPQIIL